MGLTDGTSLIGMRNPVGSRYSGVVWKPSCDHMQLGIVAVLLECMFHMQYWIPAANLWLADAEEDCVQALPYLHSAVFLMFIVF